jgi:cytochrome c biogenesis protein
VRQAVDGPPELAERWRSRPCALDCLPVRPADGKPNGGLQAISHFMEASVPEAERERAGEVLVRILNGVLFELAQLSREQAGLKPLEPTSRPRPS